MLACEFQFCPPLPLLASELRRPFFSKGPATFSVVLAIKTSIDERLHTGPISLGGLEHDVTDRSTSSANSQWRIGSDALCVSRDRFIDILFGLDKINESHRECLIRFKQPC